MKIKIITERGGGGNKDEGTILQEHMDNLGRNQIQKEKICGLYDQDGHRQTDQKSLGRPLG